MEPFTQKTLQCQPLIAPLILECSNKLRIVEKYILTVNIFNYQANEHAEVNGSFQSC